MRLLEEYVVAYDNAIIKLKAFIVTPSAEEPDLMASALRIDVVEAENFPEDIFVWERMETMLDNGEMHTVYRPVCVAKPSDLDTYPPKAPPVDPGTLPPYYRDNFVSFKIASPDILLNTWTLVKEDVTGLVTTTMKLGGP